MSEPRARVEISYSGPKVSKPVIIVGIPEAGLVGTITCSYLVEQLKLSSRGFIDSELLPQVMIVHNSTAGYPIHIFGGDSILVVLSEVPLPPYASREIASEIASWGKSLKAPLVLGVTGAPSKARDESQGEGKPTVVGVANTQESLLKMKASGASTLEDGIISGFYASLLKECNVKGQSNLTLLAESFTQFPDPAAAASVVEVVSNFLSLGLDTKPLLQESEEIRLRSRELMQETQQTAQPGAPPTSAYR